MFVLRSKRQYAFAGGNFLNHVLKKRSSPEKKKLRKVGSVDALETMSSSRADTLQEVSTT
jgi:ribosomal protein L35